uniref:N-terminal Xaa-Pro-Lys N-methyltransferase 1-like isoform X1 n=2 Tax=Myxine glutinosa TaxID=7769 RepID=UPI00358E4939
MSSLKNVIHSYFFESCNFLLKEYSLVKLFVLTSEVIDDEITFYARAKKYYLDIPPTEESMLGGYTEIADADIAASRSFINKFIKPLKGGARKEFALDCGAGIGRTTKYLLLPIFSHVDMVDMTPLFLRIARKSYLKTNIRRVRFICSPLQDFRPQPSHYDVVWIQWVTGHLTDDDLLEFLRRCRRALRQDGIVIIKDNVAHEGAHIDLKDSSVCRARPILIAIFHRAGLRVLCEERQMDFPGEILPVWTFALR